MRKLVKVPGSYHGEQKDWDGGGWGFLLQPLLPGTVLLLACSSHILCIVQNAKAGVSQTMRINWKYNVQHFIKVNAWQ